MVSKYQLLPPLTAAEYEALREDIAVAGVLVPIDVDEHGDILDGHHRKQACDELGIECPTRLVEIPDFAKADYALTVNLARRHLDQKQRRQLVWNSVKDAPGLSDRLHARRCGVSPSTVAAVRSDLVAAELVSNPDTRRDARGRQQPATKTAAGVQTSPADGASSSSTSSDASAADPAPVVTGDGAAATPTDHPAAALGDAQDEVLVVPADSSGEADGAGTPSAAQPQSDTGPQADSGSDETEVQDEAPRQSSGPVDERQPEGAGVSPPAADSDDEEVPVPAPTRIITAAADAFEDLEHDVLGREMTKAEIAAMERELDRLNATVGLLVRWHADAQLDA